MKTKKIGTFFVILGVLCVLAGALLFLYNISTDTAAKNSSDDVMAALEERVRDRMDGEAEDGDTPLDEKTGEGVMPVVVIEEYKYIGWLTIPKLDLTLPVLAQWSYDNLRIAPSLYSGSYYGNDMVICAHNYSSYFGRLNQLYTGSEIIFTDVNGNSTSYYIETGEELEPEEVSRMKVSDYDLTLFTCNFDGTVRFTVRCKRA